jgi:hypothetical protein
VTEEFDDSEYGGIFDPRDHMLGDFIYSDPEPISVERMVGRDFCWMDPGLEQLLVAEMISYEWLIENDDESISLTELGRSFANARLEKKAWWSDYATIPSAPSLPKMSSRLRLAYKASIQRYPSNSLWKVFGENWDG